MTVEWFDKRTYVSLIHMTIVTTIYWISLLRRPSPVIWQLWPSSHALHGDMPAQNQERFHCFLSKYCIVIYRAYDNIIINVQVWCKVHFWKFTIVDYRKLYFTTQNFYYLKSIFLQKLNPLKFVSAFKNWQ